MLKNIFLYAIIAFLLVFLLGCEREEGYFNKKDILNAFEQTTINFTVTKETEEKLEGYLNQDKKDTLTVYLYSTNEKAKKHFSDDFDFKRTANGFFPKVMYVENVVFSYFHKDHRPFGPSLEAVREVYGYLNALKNNKERGE